MPAPKPYTVEDTPLEPEADDAYAALVAAAEENA